MLVGTSGCMCACVFQGGNPPGVGGWVGCPPVGLGMKREGSERLREVGSQMGYFTAGGNYFHCVGVAQLSRYLQMLLLPNGIPTMPGTAMLHTKSFARLWSLEGAHHH